MSYWQSFSIDTLIRQVLSGVTYQPNPQHHFNRPFLTAYQLAIEVNRLEPRIITAMGYLIGGAGTHRNVSFSQYIALELSKRIQSGQITDIEGAFVSNNHVTNLAYDNYGAPLISSLTGTNYDLSAFRLRA
jgi:hypothetical protein